jgi:hypothetical protein
MGSFMETFATPRTKHLPKTDWAPLVAEAKRVLPSEPMLFVAAAIEVLRSSNQEVTPAAVRARLEAQGRTTAQLKAAA